jgi:hypothetical protein
MAPPRPTYSQTFIFLVRWDGPTSSHLLPNPDFFIGGIVPPRPTCSQTLSFHGVGWSHLVPPTLKPLFSTGWDGPTSSHLKPLVFMGWDGPTSSHLLPNPHFLWGGTVPPRPTYSQTLIFMGWDGPTSSHLLPNPHKAVKRRKTSPKSVLSLEIYRNIPEITA